MGAHKQLYEELQHSLVGGESLLISSEGLVGGAVAGAGQLGGAKLAGP